jgi:hypothetical protein
VDWSLAKAHLRIDSDTEQTLVEGYIDAATDFAQESLATSLMTQTLTAVFYADDCGITPPIVRYGPGVGPQSPDGNPVASLTGFYADGRSPLLRLPRGPVQSITSVTDANGHVLAGTAYALERRGHQDQMRLNVAAVFPLTVVYVAGYGAASDVPALIRQGLLCHVGTLYENRESVAVGTMAPVPHSLADFYRLRSRKIGVG